MNAKGNATPTYAAPGRIIERPTAGNVWIERGGLNCIVCGARVRGPVYYDVVFPPVRRGPPYYPEIGYDTCSRVCAEKRAREAPGRTPKPLCTDGMPTDAALTREGWIYAFREEGEYPEATENNGKWLVFLAPNEIDAAWQRVREAVRQGKVGDSAKVATRPSQWREGLRYVICVYTYNYTDTDDVRRIRQVLRELGFTWRIAYKADEDTSAGRYSKNSGRISKFYE